MTQIAQVIRLKPKAEAAYKKLHAEIWPEIASAIHEAGIRNYSIFLHDGLLFACYEYVGTADELAAALSRLAQAPRMREWWDLTDAMQTPLDNRANGEWWAAMEEVFHLD